MNDQRFVVTTYCDDIRQEVGNKLSLIGCYGAELVVNKLPAALPKLCALVKVFTPVDRPFGKLCLRALFNDEQIGELEVPISELEQSRGKLDGITPRWLMFSAVMTFSPLSIPERSVIRIDVETEEGSIRGPSLVLRDPSGEQATPMSLG